MAYIIFLLNIVILDLFSEIQYIEENIFLKIPEFKSHLPILTTLWLELNPCGLGFPHL